MKAAEISVISTTSPKGALIEIVPLFERASGHKVNIIYGAGSEMGGKIRSGALGDLLIAPGEFVGPLIKEGRVLAGSVVNFARSKSSVAVRAGAPKPDISSPEQFKDALVAARTVSFSRGASGLLFMKVIARLGITERIKEKAVMPQRGELVGTVVARGDAEIGIQQLSELVVVPGIDIVGPLPGELQEQIVYGASMLPSIKQPEAAKEFVKFLRSESAAPIFKKKGMEPI